MPSNPLTQITPWTLQIGLVGLGFGLPLGIGLALDTDPTIGLAGLVMVPVLLGLMGALSGLVTGMVLRALRGRVPAAIGLLLAAVAAASPYLALLMSDAGTNWQLVATWLPLWAVMVGAAVPVSAVVRSRGRPGHGWMLGIGALLGMASLALRLLG